MQFRTFEGETLKNPGRPVSQTTLAIQAVVKGVAETDRPMAVDIPEGSTYAKLAQTVRVAADRIDYSVKLRVSTDGELVIVSAKPRNPSQTATEAPTSLPVAKAAKAAKRTPTKAAVTPSAVAKRSGKVSVQKGQATSK